MKKSRFTAYQIIAILKEADASLSVKEVCRQHGISQATFYQWKSKFGGLEASDTKRLRDLEGELTQYKKMYAELAHENYALRRLSQKSFNPL
jgi:putative transposase